MTRKAKSAHLDVDKDKYQELIASPWISQYPSPVAPRCKLRILIYNRYSELDLIDYWHTAKGKWVPVYALWSREHEIPNGQEWDKEVLMKVYKARVDELMKIAGAVLEVETEVER